MLPVDNVGDGAQERRFSNDPVGRTFKTLREALLRVPLEQQISEAAVRALANARASVIELADEQRILVRAAARFMPEGERVQPPPVDRIAECVESLDAQISLLRMESERLSRGQAVRHDPAATFEAE